MNRRSTGMIAAAATYNSSFFAFDLKTSRWMIGEWDSGWYLRSAFQLTRRRFQGANVFYRNDQRENHRFSLWTLIPREYEFVQTAMPDQYASRVDLLPNRYTSPSGLTWWSIYSLPTGLKRSDLLNLFNPYVYNLSVRNRYTSKLTF